MGLFQITRATQRASIRAHGLRAGRGWSAGDGAFVTTNPRSWLFLFEDDGIYATRGALDIWEIDARGLTLIPDTNETATTGEDFIIPAGVTPDRLRLVETLPALTP